ncbi:MAG TPA: amino acid permease [Candidatus Omnitrophica bacterium]|nr:MAG: transporter [Omnitrophica WOR_2 bacterium GWA2_45_18]OGX18320.1 MAG: transporter [Omnitrophica WOR_2 bacterium GWC2_45_7]HBR15049.1 amino acid permease [Candidatus Omnitrophota bacterium]
MTDEPKSRLSRQLTTWDAVIIGISAMIGSGIFVAIGPAAGSAGSGILIGIIVAACVAYCNATSSAQLAAVYPESGGTYIYGRKQLSPFWGWLAGWAFVVGKLASCAAAALTFGYYVYPSLAKFLSLGAVIGLTVLNYFGIQKTARMTWGIVMLVLGALAMIVATSLFGGKADVAHLSPLLGDHGIQGILRSAALMFFAFAGYARIATMGEEIKNPRQTIPKAIVMALVITTFIYLSVVASALLAIGPLEMAQSKAPLAEAVNAGKFFWLTPVVRLGAAVATLGVLLSLMVGISRTIFSMAANRDLPHGLSIVHPKFKVPHRAEIIVAFFIGLIVMIGDVRSAVGFSAFTILIYYAITNASAISLPKEKRLWPRYFAGVGLCSCLLLALSLPVQSLIVGGIVITAGAIIYFMKSKI